MPAARRMHLNSFRAFCFSVSLMPSTSKQRDLDHGVANVKSWFIRSTAPHQLEYNSDQGFPHQFDKNSFTGPLLGGCFLCKERQTSISVILPSSLSIWALCPFDTDRWWLHRIATYNIDWVVDLDTCPYSIKAASKYSWHRHTLTFLNTTMLYKTDMTWHVKMTLLTSLFAPW